MLDLKDISIDYAMNSSGIVREARRQNHVEGGGGIGNLPKSDYWIRLRLGSSG
jgi:hypothetical protein